MITENDSVFVVHSQPLLLECNRLIIKLELNFLKENNYGIVVVANSVNVDCHSLTVWASSRFTLIYLYIWPVVQAAHWQRFAHVATS